MATDFEYEHRIDVFDHDPPLYITHFRQLQCGPNHWPWRQTASVFSENPLDYHGSLVQACYFGDGWHGEDDGNGYVDSIEEAAKRQFAAKKRRDRERLERDNRRRGRC